MKRHIRAGGLFACVTTVMVLAGCPGIARAQPDTDPPPLPPPNGEWVQFPQTFVNPSNQGQPTNDSGETGMVCENLLVPCR